MHYALLAAFKELTGCPVLIETSFNVYGEPNRRYAGKRIPVFQGNPTSRCSPSSIAIYVPAPRIIWWAPSPRVINVDGHPAYASAITELKQSGELGRRCHCRTSPYMNNIIEQDHRFIKKRITASLGFRSAEGAWRTIQGYEAMHVIRKGQIRLVAKSDPVAERQFIHTIFGVGV